MLASPFPVPATKVVGDDNALKLEELHILPVVDVSTLLIVNGAAANESDR